MTNHLFELAGNRKTETVIPKSKKKWYQGKPVVSAAILILIVLGCLCAELIMTKDPAYMDLLNYNKAPDREFLFGTDTMGRDIFSMIWYGGRISILIGGLATVISTFIAVVVGAFSGVAPAWLDELIMRFTEIFLSIPTLLLIILLQAIMGDANILSLSFVIGVTSWTSIAKVVPSTFLPPDAAPPRSRPPHGEDRRGLLPPRGHTLQAMLRLAPHPAPAQTGVPGCGNKPALPP